jgi:integrase
MARPYKGWSVFYRAEKRRWVLSRDGKQKLIPADCKNKRAAVLWATTWLTEHGYLESDGTAKRQDETETIATLARRWVKWRESLMGKDWEPATVSNNRSHVKNHIIPRIGHHAIVDVTPRVVAEFVRSLTCAPNTARNVYRSLVAMFSDAISQEWVKLDFNPAEGDSARRAVPDAMTKAQEVQADTRFSIGECQRLVSDPRIPTERRVKYLTALTLVARDGEVMGLSWGAIDFDTKTVRIFQTAKIRRYTSDPSVGSPKTQKSRRTVPLHHATEVALADWKRLTEHTVGGPVDPNHPVFPGRKRDEFTRTHAAKLLRQDLVRLGIREQVSGVNLQFHHLRHTALNVLRESGVESAVRDYLAGHSPRGVGEGTYQHRSIESMRSDIEKIAIDWAGVRGSFCADLDAQVTKTSPEEEK